MPLSVPKTRDVEFPELHQEAAALVSELAGIMVNPTELIFKRRGGGDFTPQDEQRLREVYDRHDAPEARVAKRTREIVRKREMAKDPATLSLPDRLRRLELVLGVEKAIQG